MEEWEFDRARAIALANVKKEATKAHYNSQTSHLSQQSPMMNKHQNSRPRTQCDFYCHQDIEQGDNPAAKKCAQLSVR